MGNNKVTRVFLREFADNLDIQGGMAGQIQGQPNPGATMQYKHTVSFLEESVTLDDCIDPHDTPESTIRSLARVNPRHDPAHISG